MPKKRFDAELLRLLDLSYKIDIAYLVTILSDQ